MEPCASLLIAALIFVGPGAAVLFTSPFVSGSRLDPLERRVPRLIVYSAALAAAIIGGLATASNCW